jgi:hypothetical protein
MTPTFRLLFAAFMAVVTISCTAVSSGAPDRGFDGVTLVSSRKPVLRITPADGFAYIGATKMIIKESALAERHHWVVTEGDQVRALLIAQFEGFLDGVDGRYQYAAPTTEEGGSNYLFTTGPVMIGGTQFVHNTWALDHAANARENPGTEAPSTLALLQEKGLSLDDAVVMSRFVRALGPDQRREFIIFYLEPLTSHGASLGDFPDGGELSQAYRDLSRDITARSLSAFQLEYEAD